MTGVHFRVGCYKVQYRDDYYLYTFNLTSNFKMSCPKICEFYTALVVFFKENLLRHFQQSINRTLLCLGPALIWVIEVWPKLKDEKTDVLVISTGLTWNSYQNCWFYHVQATELAYNHGMIADNSLDMPNHIKTVCRELFTNYNSSLGAIFVLITKQRSVIYFVVYQIPIISTKLSKRPDNNSH